MISDLTSVTALWGAVIFSGIYHGINPGMGWPLAVSAALMDANTKPCLGRSPCSPSGIFWL